MARVASHAVDVAADVTRIMRVFTNYIYQTILTEDGVLVKVGNTANKQAGVVNVSNHKREDSNKLQDKLLAVKLAYRLHKYLQTKPNKERG